MSSPNFIDYVIIYTRSGNGGPGAVHFRREKFIPKGGPDGGNGGRGGHVIIKANKQLWTLLHLKYFKHVIAESGKGGSAALRTGAQGKDRILEVPLGTIARNAETGKILAEIVDEGQEFIITPGGQGGMGNDHFKSPTNQTPRFAQPGGPGIEQKIILELKVLADVGLVGFPNAGKSTFLAAVSEAKPKIADYPFTTLTPNLGVVSFKDYKSFVVADIPGIIEGAAEGKGLGTRFLRHIERNSILLFMIPTDADDIKKNYSILLGELEKYNPELLDKKRILAITKADLLDHELKESIRKELPEEVESVLISSITGEGIESLKVLIWNILNN
jgi:GTP-binding protein